VITIHQRYRQTDGQTTCDRNTALCTTVHRAVKTNKCFSTEKHGKILSYSYVIFYCYDNYKTLFFYEKMAATYRVPSGIKMCLSFMSSTLSASKCDASKLFLVTICQRKTTSDAADKQNSMTSVTICLADDRLSLWLVRRSGTCYLTVCMM